MCIVKFTMAFVVCAWTTLAVKRMNFDMAQKAQRVRSHNCQMTLDTSSNRFSPLLSTLPKR